MRVEIAKREQRDGKIIRVLVCGHETVEPSGGAAYAATDALCRICTLRSNRAKTPTPTRYVPPPPDTRSELERLADGVERVWHWPAGRAWSTADVAVKKLIDAAKRHACRVEVSQSNPENTCPPSPR